MATNLDIAPNLIQRAQQLGRHRTKKAAVTEALEEYIRRREQQEITELFGTVEYGTKTIAKTTSKAIPRRPSK